MFTQEPFRVVGADDNTRVESRHETSQERHVDGVDVHGKLGSSAQKVSEWVEEPIVHTDAVKIHIATAL